MKHRPSEEQPGSVVARMDAPDWLRLVGERTAQRNPRPRLDRLDDKVAAVHHCLAMARALLEEPCPQHRPSQERGSCILGTSSWAERACLLAVDLVTAGANGHPYSAQAHPPAMATEDKPMAYLAAIVTAAEAVYFCRRVEHAHGACWFDPHHVHDQLCGRVLAVAHALRPATSRTVSKPVG